MIFIAIFLIIGWIILFKIPNTPPPQQTHKYYPPEKKIEIVKEIPIEMPKKKPIEWFVDKRALSSISEAEKLISIELNRYNCSWFREISFTTLKTEKGYHRFDFLVCTPSIPIGYFIIEYDGKLSHSTQEQKDKDRKKTAFCLRNNIPLMRYNSKHYYQLSYEVSALMNKYGIKKK